MILPPVNVTEVEYKKAKNPYEESLLKEEKLIASGVPKEEI